VFTAGTGITTTDAGANGNFTVSVNDAVVATLTSSVSFSNGISGSLTRLSNGKSYITSGPGVSVASSSNGQVTISSNSGNHIFNEYLGQANGSNTRFTLSKVPTAPKNISVFVNGLLQMPAIDITSAPFQDYSVTGSNIYFNSSSIPHNGSILMTNYTTNEEV